MNSVTRPGGVGKKGQLARNVEMRLCRGSNTLSRLVTLGTALNRRSAPIFWQRDSEWRALREAHLLLAVSVEVSENWNGFTLSKRSLGPTRSCIAFSLGAQADVARTLQSFGVPFGKDLLEFLLQGAIAQPLDRAAAT